ncbi:hypothetical protein [Falsirhodobacter xinxiangensis]|uniref:hypothetical protein n=1 Tax=Falsirhodobacter xinxiangensis TaxID=2530049 RepID=UPI001C6FE986|nr:hypothetical protein [Rhodobacter xinxiangensis]
MDGRWHKKLGFLVVELFFPIIDGTAWQVIRHEIFHAKAHNVEANVKAEAVRIYAMTKDGPTVHEIYARSPELIGSEWGEEALVRLADMQADRQPIPQHSPALACTLNYLLKRRFIAAGWSAIVWASTLIVAWLVVAGIAFATPAIHNGCGAGMAWPGHFQ